MAAVDGTGPFSADAAAGVTASDDRVGTRYGGNMSNEWIAVYQRYGSVESDVFDTEDEAISFLHGQEEALQLVAIGVHGPDGEKWNKARIDRHFQEIYERDHADEIAAEKQKAEEARARHEAWLAAQPPWKRDWCSMVKVDAADGYDAYPKVELNGVVLPFRVGEPEITFDSSRGHTLVLQIPLAPDVQIQKVRPTEGP